MKAKLLGFLWLLSCCGSTTPLLAQTDACQEGLALLEALQRYHVSPREMDAAETDLWWQQTLLQLDDKGLLWTQADVVTMKETSTPLAESLQEADCALFERVETTLNRRLTWALALLDSAIELPYQPTLTFPDWSQGDTTDWASSDAVLRERWIAWLQMRTLASWLDQKPDTIDPTDQQALLRAWPQVREALRQQVVCDLSQQQQPRQGQAQRIMEVALNALANFFDPHTAYFSAQTVEQFEADLATSVRSFGLGISQNDQGEIEIDKLEPGGPAWRSHVLHEGDVIISLVPAGKEALDLGCINPEDVEAFLVGEDIDAILLTVRKSTGQIRDVELEKATLLVSENVVNGFVLEGEHRLGYMYLPGFYTDFESMDLADGLANDVTKELLKLRLTGIEGLILDLRFNGGGAMLEAIALAGLFIDEGPLSILTGSGEEAPDVLKDFYRGTGYDGPLLVLVNGLSASASEMFAAAMQDYRRAVIVGDQTYGKATGQVVEALAALPDVQGGKGFIKVTGSRFFRVNGRTHQQVGIVPDVLLPNPWRGLLPSEADEPYALSAEPVAAASHVALLPDLPLDQLWQRSANRVRNSAAFDGLMQWEAKLPNAWKRMNRPPLTLTAFAAAEGDIQAAYAAIDTLLHQPVAAYNVKNHPLTESLIRLDDIRRARNERQLSRIRTDVYLEEAYFILSDLIKLTP